MIIGEIENDLIVNQLQQGDKDAFNRLYHLYSKQLLLNIFRLVKDEEIAEEILQELFIKIWDIREKIDPDKSFKSFLYKVAENMVYGHFRQVARNQRLLDNLVLVSTGFDSSDDDTLLTEQSYTILQNAIAHLSPQRKLIYKLCKFEGKSYQQVADELEISTSTVRVQIVKANKAVKQYFLTNQNMAVLLIVGEIIKNTKQ